MKHIKNLIENGKYADACALAIFLKKTYETRELFSQDKNIGEEKFDAFENLLLADAHQDFDCYCRYLDYRQPLARNFYLDRRSYLKDISDSVTNMYFPKDGEVELDVVRIKLPTRTGKSEIFNRLAFFVQSIKPNGETLHCVGGGRLKDSVHLKRVAFIDEYWDRHLDVFPDMKVDRMSKGDASVWFANKEYADIATVTVGGSIEGFVQCSNLLIMDDLVASSEINSVNRLEEIYESDILNAITRRIVGRPKVVLIGTPIPTQTDVGDPLDRYLEYRKLGGDACKEFVTPALDENSKSNIAYRKFSADGKYEWFETTEQLLKERKSAYARGNPIEIATFETTRQMNPMELGSKRFANIQFYELEPQGLYKEINILDTADKGTDAAVCIHGRIYDDQPKLVYIHDIFYDKRPMDTGKNGGFLDDLVRFLIKNNIHLLKYEENMGGTLLGEKLKDICSKNNHVFSYETYRQTKNKVQRILDVAMEVIEVVRIKENYPSESYGEAVKEIMNWTESAKHDDAIDCLTKVVEETLLLAMKPNEFMILTKPLF